MLAGTDAPNPGTAHGASMHRELELLVKAGLTPVEALARGDVGAGAHVLARRSRTHRRRASRRPRARERRSDDRHSRDARHRRRVEARASRSIATPTAPSWRRLRPRRPRGSFAVPLGSESGDVSDFDAGQPTVKFGAGWFVTTDQLAGGKSVAAIKVVTGGANGTPARSRSRARSMRVCPTAGRA